MHVQIRVGRCRGCLCDVGGVRLPAPFLGGSRCLASRMDCTGWTMTENGDTMQHPQMPNALYDRGKADLRAKSQICRCSPAPHEHGGACSSAWCGSPKAVRPEGPTRMLRAVMAWCICPRGQRDKRCQDLIPGCPVAMSSLDQQRRRPSEITSPHVQLVKHWSPKAKKNLVAPGGGRGWSEQQLASHVRQRTNRG